MISLRRIWAIVLRHLRLFDEINRLIWTFYWPLLDMLLFGLTSTWIQKQAVTSSASLTMIMGIVFWQIVNRASVEASTDLLEEIWALNMLNLFASPLRLAEWIIAIAILSFALSSIVVIYCAVIVWLFYSSPVIFLIPQCLPFLFSLFIAGLWLGFFGTALIMYYGARVQWIPWMLGWLFAPLCSALYPSTVLPIWAQKISWWIPMTPAFEGIRQVAETGIINYHYLGMSLATATIYCSLSLLLLAFLFDKSKERGFARFTAD